jgi:serine/threonine protein kinase
MSPFLKRIGEAIASKGIRALVGAVPLGELLYDIVIDVVDQYRRDNDGKALLRDFNETLSASMEEVRFEAREIAEAVSARNSAVNPVVLETYLCSIPGAARRSLRSIDDPTGHSALAKTNLFDPNSLASLLPDAFSRRCPGDPIAHASQWKLVELLGTGGFGDVWLGRHEFLGEQRAFKFCRDEGIRRRLLTHEGAVLVELMKQWPRQNPDSHGVVPLLDACIEEEVAWLAYEYMDGGDLSMLIRSLSSRSIEHRAKKAVAILRILSFVVGRFHRLAHPLVHRDLKPSNVMIRRNGSRCSLLITDFGISHLAAKPSVRNDLRADKGQSIRQTLRGTFTPLYASPQQRRNEFPSPEDDVFSLAIIFYQVLTGDLTSDRPAGQWRKRVKDSMLSTGFLDLIERCWDDDASERPGDAFKLNEAIEALTPFVSDSKVRHIDGVDESKTPGGAAPSEFVNDYKHIPLVGQRPSGTSTSLVYSVRLLARASIRYLDESKGVDIVDRVAHIFYPQVDSDLTMSSETDVCDTELEEEGVVGAVYTTVPVAVSDSRSFVEWKSSYVKWLSDTRGLPIWHCPQLGIYSAPFEEELEFRHRIASRSMGVIQSDRDGGEVVDLENAFGALEQVSIRAYRSQIDVESIIPVWDPFWCSDEVVETWRKTGYVS